MRPGGLSATRLFLTSVGVLACTPAVHAADATLAERNNHLRATSLKAATDCGEGATGDSTARFTWQVATTAGDEQRIVITIVRDGFDRDDSEMSGELPAAATKFDWKPKRTRTTHFWQVVTRHGTTWVPSDPGYFSPARCGPQGLTDPMLPPQGRAPVGTESPIPHQPEW
jgi:hypothetical protein